MIIAGHRCTITAQQTREVVIFVCFLGQRRESVLRSCCERPPNDMAFALGQRWVVGGWRGASAQINNRRTTLMGHLNGSRICAGIAADVNGCWWRRAGGIRGIREFLCECNMSIDTFVKERAIALFTVLRWALLGDLHRLSKLWI